MNRIARTLTAAAASTLLLAASPSLRAQGTLTPPGAPAATMKTLQQIEPRTDLLATPAPPGVDTSNAAFHYIINQPGSYYLSANVNVTKTNGIQINGAAIPGEDGVGARIPIGCAVTDDRPGVGKNPEIGQVIVDMARFKDPRSPHPQARIRASSSP